MKTININGIDYVKKEMLDELKADISKSYVKKEELDKLRNQAKMFLKDLDSVVDEKKVVTKKRNRQDEIWKPSKTASKPIKIEGVNKNDFFIKDTGRLTPYRVKDVQFLKENTSARTTHRDIRTLSKLMRISPPMIRNILYNIRVGTFDEFIQ